jgi:signal transduction histidine kinase
MKLLTKTNIYFSTTTILLVLIGMSIVYVLVLNKINSEVDEHLLLDKGKIIELLKQGKPVPHFSSNVGENIEIKEITEQTVFNNQFKDYIVDEQENEEGDDEITFRLLLFETKINNKNYEIKISQSLSEKKEIGEFIAGIIIIFLVFSFSILFFLNRYISKFIWSPFYNTIKQLRAWSMKENKQIVSAETNIDEFNELNHTINMFIEKINADYINLKEFTENISHETQTPVAVISAKLEMLMQENNYSGNQQRLLSDAYTATLRLKKLNQALISLIRIEKGSFSSFDILNLTVAIEKKLVEMSEFIHAKNIRVEKKLDQVEKFINVEIFNMLINNLMINAIRHNSQNGVINITLKPNELIIENTGAEKRIEKENLFERFKPYTTSNDSVGLGLSIIKKIADFLEWDLSYEFQDNLHIFRLTWRENNK